MLSFGKKAKYLHSISIDPYISTRETAETLVDIYLIFLANRRGLFLGLE